MGRFKEKLYRFMYGRYGTDELYRFLLISALVLLVLQLIVKYVSYTIPDSIALSITGTCLSVLILVLYIWMIFRSMSKNIVKRRRENQLYLKARAGVRRFFTFNTSSKSKSGNKDTAAYIFRDCTKCSSTLRLPRKDGRNKVKCPRCSHSFYVKSKKFKN